MHDTTACIEVVEGVARLSGYAVVFANPGDSGVQWSKWTEFKFRSFESMPLFWCHEYRIPFLGKVNNLYRDQYGIRIEADLWRDTPNFIQLIQSGIVGYTVGITRADKVNMPDGTQYATSCEIGEVSLSLCTACNSTKINTDKAARKLAATDWKSSTSVSEEKFQPPDGVTCCLFSPDVQKSQNAQEKISRASFFSKVQP
jgi:hypothetical protein